MPPTAVEPLSPGIFLGPALRAQPDRRLVRLVREGYEVAFEEIVRRYRKPLDRFAAAIVGGRSEDVTQDAFSKALLALRGSETDIELKPWLYRIVRNTALNELRDGPPPTEELGEGLPGGVSAAVEAERREETAELMRRLRALPEPQRAAIVMRELEGLSHEEIAAALGVSGGAARQAIHRGRTALRNGFGLLIPLPLLRVFFDHGVEAAGAGTGAALAAGAASAGGAGGASLGAIGAGGALKAGVAVALIAGSVGAGVAMQHDRNDGASAARNSEATAGLGGGPNQSAPGGGGDFTRSGDESNRGPGGNGSDEGSRRAAHGDSGGDAPDDSSHGGGPGPSDSSGHGGGDFRSGGRDFGRSGHSGESSGEDHGSHSGSGGGPGGDRGGGEGTSGGSGSGRDDSGGGGESGASDNDSDSADEGHGGGPGPSEPSPTASQPAPEAPAAEPSDDSGGSNSGSGGGGEPDS
jgi:RNA polymerase sigma factor (sigma-70 family)